MATVLSGEYVGKQHRRAPPDTAWHAGGISKTTTSIFCTTYSAVRGYFVILTPPAGLLPGKTRHFI